MRDSKIKEAVDAIKTEVTDKQEHDLSSLLTRDDVDEALKLSANGKATGLQGIPYEAIKIVNAWNVANKKNDEPGFDIVRTMQLVFNNIERHGMCEGTGFAESWMCPLYKKND